MTWTRVPLPGSSQPSFSAVQIKQSALPYSLLVDHIYLDNIQLK